MLNEYFKTPVTERNVFLIFTFTVFWDKNQSKEFLLFSDIHKQVAPCCDVMLKEL